MITRIFSLSFLLFSACTGDTGKPTVDIDGDGWSEEDGDCDDAVPTINPSATDIAGDGLDQNCDGTDGVDVDGDGVASNFSGGEDCDDLDPEVVASTTYYMDLDRDGYGDLGIALESCEELGGYVTDSSDCNDADATISPDAVEICDEIDNDCDGLIDDDDDSISDQSAWYADADGDGYGDADDVLNSCNPPVGYVADNTDCVDTSTNHHPGAAEEDCTDPEDYNCDGSVGYADVDGDGFAACEDCEDSVAAINPNAGEVCDGADNDCDGDVDEDDAADAFTWYLDADGDGYGDVAADQDACSAPSGYVGNADDCNDDEVLAWTGAAESCDTVDNNCDGSVDEGVTTTYYADADGDGYGDGASPVEACSQPSGAASNSYDCNDAEPLAWFGAAESCDEVDNNCDGSVDEGVTTTFYTDADGDGYGDVAAPVEACAQASGVVSNSDDCDDSAGETWPGAAQLEASPGDCMADADLDGFGDENATGAVVPGTDCNDQSSAINPLQTDVQGDGTDQNCDGVDGTDSDGDGFASAASGGSDCDDTDSAILPTTDGDGDGFDCNADCDDADATIYPGATDIPEDGTDQNCDGSDPSYATYLSDVNIATDVAADYFCTAYNNIAGNLYIDLTSLTNNTTAFMDCVESVGGQLNVQGDSSSEFSFASLEEVGEGLYLQNGGSVFNFPALTEVGNSMEISPDSVALDGDVSFPVLETVEDQFYITNASLTELTGFSALTSVENLYLNNNSSLVTISGFSGLESIVNQLQIENNSNLTSITGFDALESLKYVYVYSNSSLTSITGFDVLESVQQLYIYNNQLLDTLSGFGVLESLQNLNVYDNPLLSSAQVCPFFQSNTTNYNIYNLLDSFDRNECDADGDGYTPNTNDCDDGNATTYPGATETCDAEDNDCDGSLPADEADGDGDGYMVCGNDCDDSDASFNPGAPDLCDDGLDQNCDGSDSTSVDLDGDGISSCDGDCDDSDATNTDLLGSVSCPAGSCVAIASTDLINSGDAAYYVTLADSSVEEVFCEMSTAGGGWTLFGITDSDECAENLDYGPDGLVDRSGAPYLSTLLQDESHTSFLQVFQADGSTTDFTIVYAFTDGIATLSDRFDSAVSSGEGVSWGVSYQGSTYSLSGTWWFSNGADTSSKWSGSGSNFSNDDGCWGAANGTLDGNGSAYINSYSDSWGHENPNSGDSQCQTYFVDGSQQSSGSIRNYMYYR